MSRDGLRLGVHLPLLGLDLVESARFAAGLEASGYSEIWSSEVAANDAFTPLAYAAALTRTMRLGTAVVPAYTRPPALLAMTCASLQALSGGRFRLGIGSSTPAIIERWMGLPFANQLGRIRETIAALRAAEAGGRVDVDGETLRVSGFRLQLAATATPVLVGAMGPRMMALAGEAADGVVTSMVSPDGLRAVLEPFQRAARAAGRDPEQLDVVLQVSVSIDGDPGKVRDAIRPGLASYGVIDIYNKHLERQGFAAEAAALREAWTRRDREASLAAVSDDLCDAVSAVGDVDDVRQKLRAWGAAGVRTLIVSPVVPGADAGEQLRRAEAMLLALAKD